MAVAIVVAVILGLNPPGFAAQTVALAFGLAAATIFSALMMGVISTRVNNVGAVAGMLSGLTFTQVYIFLHKGWLFIPGTNSFPDTVDGSLLGIQSTAIGAVGALINFAVAYGVSMATKDTRARDQGSGRKRSCSGRCWRRFDAGPNLNEACGNDRPSTKYFVVSASL